VKFAARGRFAQLASSAADGGDDFVPLHAMANNKRNCGWEQGDFALDCGSEEARLFCLPGT
jgi:hypothetical protein